MTEKEEDQKFAVTQTQKGQQLWKNDDTGKFYLVNSDGAKSKLVNRNGERPHMFDAHISGKINFNKRQ